jgi:hypothetical protein
MSLKHPHIQATSANTGGPDQWLSPEAEALFNEIIGNSMPPVQEALSMKEPWIAFLLVFRRYDPTIPPCLNGALDTLKIRVLTAWDRLSRSNDTRMQHMRNAVEGICTRILNIPLFHPESELSQRSQHSQEKGGLIFFTRTPPTAPCNPMSHCRGVAFTDRMEAICCIWMISRMFAIIGYEPEQADLAVGTSLHLKPYYDRPEPFVERAPDRRSCSQLAVAAQCFRLHHFDPLPGRIFKPIVETPDMAPSTSFGTSSNSNHRKGKWSNASAKSSKSHGAQPPQEAAHRTAVFSTADMKLRAGMPDDNEWFPAEKTLCWFSARIREFASVAWFFYSLYFTSVDKVCS